MIEVAIDTTVVDNKSAARPWTRFWARLFDIYLFNLLVGVVLAFTAPEALEKANDYAVGLSALFLWVFVEAGLLATWGTTPGKALLKTKLRTVAGEPLRLGQAIGRSFDVWWRGLGIGFPFVPLFTMSAANGLLRKTGATSWDSDGGYHVAHESPGVGRIAVMVLFFVGFAALVALGASSTSG